MGMTVTSGLETEFSCKENGEIGEIIHPENSVLKIVIHK
jgi:hypothetical protein